MSSNGSDVRRPRPASEELRDNAAHLAAELAWLHEVIRGEIRAASTGRAGDAAVDEFAGLYISREEIERYLGRTGANDQEAAETAGRPVRDEVARARAGLDRRVQQA